jgi:hypothetical protein
MQYRFRWAYRSNAGVFEKGQVVNFASERAAWFNRDSPGVLEEIVTETRAPDAPAHDRMMRPRGRRKAAKE